MTTDVAPKPSETKPAQEDKTKKDAERPPQEQELLCTICGMRSCWR
jgi:hypothetical protein